MDKSRPQMPRLKPMAIADLRPDRQTISYFTFNLHSRDGQNAHPAGVIVYCEVGVPPAPACKKSLAAKLGCVLQSGEQPQKRHEEFMMTLFSLLREAILGTDVKRTQFAIHER